jgi:hypothetical protein
MNNKLFISISELDDLVKEAVVGTANPARGLRAYLSTSSQIYQRQVQGVLSNAAPIMEARSHLVVQIYPKNSTSERIYYWLGSLGVHQVESEPEAARMRRMMNNVMEFIKNWLHAQQVDYVEGSIAIPNNVPLSPGDTRMFEINFETGDLLIPTPSVRE